MENIGILNKPARNWLSITGIVLSIISTTTYIIFKSIPSFGFSDGLLFVNFAITILYFAINLLTSIIKNKWRFWKLNKHCVSKTIVLFCISAYSLNLFISIFNTFTLWTEIGLFIILIPLLVSDFLDKFPLIIKIVLAIISGFAIVLGLYFSIYLLPYYPIGFITILFLGLGIHIFSPLFLTFNVLYHFLKQQRNKQINIAFISAISAPLLLLVVYLAAWQNVKLKVDDVHYTIKNNSKRDLPEWILIAQNLDYNLFTETLLKNGIYYAEPDRYSRDFFRFPNLNNSITLKHDPFIYTASYLFGPTPISEENKYKILNSMYDKRHDNEEKFWRGDDLETKEINTNIDIYPDYRMAYTEKTIKIHNKSLWDWDEQEALYSFYIPEGAVVSSLSLWVDGVERKSRLSTKKKANAAYSDIVGVQMRDPAIAHWQEGNRIIVKVFPCTPKEDRVFKVGITSVLKFNNHKLSYIDIYFDGPVNNNLEQNTFVKINYDKDISVSLPNEFNGVDLNTFTSDKILPNEFKITIDAPKINQETFCFNNNCYQVNEQKKAIEKYQFDNIYLDANASLTLSEWKEILNICKDKNLFVFNDTIIKVSSENKSNLFEKLNIKQFSLFPIFNINPKNSLLITKNNTSGPNLEDLNKSKFKNKLSTYFESMEGSIKTFAISDLSNYLSSLNQFQILDVHYGDLSDLNSVVQGNFPSKSNNDSIVYLDDANMSITKINSAIKGNAPNHLLRLFAINQLMKKIGKHFYNRELYEDELIDIANEAFILSPISSLIVLETDEDYKEHDIPKNTNSIQNAIKTSSGGVPEPHEWALIIIALAFLSLLYFKKNEGFKI